MSQWLLILSKIAIVGECITKRTMDGGRNYHVHVSIVTHSTRVTVEEFKLLALVNNALLTRYLHCLLDLARLEQGQTYRENNQCQPGCSL